MNIETGEAVAVIAAMILATTLGSIVVVALQPSKAVLGKIAQFLPNKLSTG